MVIYKTTEDYKNIKKGTHLTFNKSMQYFETLNHEEYITNNDSFRNPNLIVIYKTLTVKSEVKKVWNIPY